MAVKTITKNYLVAQNSALVLHPATSDEANVRGLNSLALPTGFEQTTLTISEMGRRIDILAAAGGTYTPIDVTVNYITGDPTQTELQSAALNATSITDMRFYLKQGCDFAALDLISDAGGAYSIGNMGAPTVGAKNELYTRQMTILPGGSSIEYIAHTTPGAGADITFTSETTTGAGATAVLSTGTWAGFGFEEDDTVIIDYNGANDPLYAKVDTISTVTMTFVEATGDSASITDGAGAAASAVHGGTPIEVTGLSTTCD